MSAPNKTTILIHLHVAALLLGGTAQFSKLLEFSALDIIAYRTLICGVLLLAITLGIKQKLVFRKPAELCLLLFCSALFTVHWSAYFHAMQVSSIAVGIVAMFTFPVMTVFLEPLIKRTHIDTFDIGMAFLVLLGVYLLVPSFDLNNPITEGVCFGLLSAFAVALRNVLVSKYLAHHSAFSIMTYHALVSFALLLPFATVTPQSITGSDWMLLFLLGTLFTAVPHTQKTYGLQHSSAKTVSMIVSLQVVYACLFAYLLLGEGIGFSTALGGGFILLAAIAESVRSRSPGTKAITLDHD